MNDEAIHGSFRIFRLNDFLYELESLKLLFDPVPDHAILASIEEADKAMNKALDELCNRKIT